MVKKYLQNCGDWLIIDSKSTTKVRNRYLYDCHFDGYTRKYVQRLDEIKSGLIKNIDQPDAFGFVCDARNVDTSIYFIWKNIERRCYYKDIDGYSNYGAKGVYVSEYFKYYSNFKRWFTEHKLEYSCDIDKDCICEIEGIYPKCYSEKTCILIPKTINTFLSTLGHGIYKTKHNTYCVRSRRVNKKINKNFKIFTDAVNFKMELDREYLEILLKKFILPETTINYLRKYVEICRYVDRP